MWNGIENGRIVIQLDNSYCNIPIHRHIQMFLWAEWFRAFRGSRKAILLRQCWVKFFARSSGFVSIFIYIGQSMLLQVVRFHMANGMRIRNQNKFTAHHFPKNKQKAVKPSKVSEKFFEAPLPNGCVGWRNYHGISVFNHIRCLPIVADSSTQIQGK